MVKLYLIILLLPFLPAIWCFNCDSVTNSSLCPQMTGCTWNGTFCNGTFAPSCAFANCFYIDPITGSDSANGTALLPFQTLTRGFQRMVGRNGSLFVLNYVLNIEVELLNYTMTTSNISINRIFSVPYVLSLRNFDISSIPSNQSSAITVNSSRLEFIGCVMNEKTVPPRLNNTVFEVGSAGLFFRDVSIYDYQGPVKLVYTASDKTTAQFNYTRGEHRSSSFSFQLLGGTQTFNSIQFIDNKAQDNILNVGTTVTLTNIFVSGGTSLFLLIARDTTCTITNLTIDGYSANVLDAININRLIMSSSAFRNIYSNSSIPLFRVSGAGKSYFSFSPHSIRQTTFQNLTVKNSVLLLEKNAQQITMDTITMIDIKKIALTILDYTLDDLEFRSEWPGGVCALARKSVVFAISSSNFINIGSHCLGMRFSSLVLTNSTFNNSALEYNSTKITENDIDEYYGVSWINFRSGMTDVTPGNNIRITQNYFYENKISPNYGGALRILGTFVVTFNLTSNQFFNNGALYGGAVYIENPLFILLVVNNTFYRNSAKQGGAIYKVGNGLDLLTTVGASITITNSTFIENKVSDKGGAVYLNYETLALANTTFTRCQAQDGGAIYYINFNTAIDPKYRAFNNNTFLANVASNSGGAMKLFFDYSELNQNRNLTSVYVDNTDFKGQSISDGRPSHYIFSFYNLISEQKLLSTDDLDTWIKNSSLTALAYQINSSAYPPDFKLSHKSGHELDQIVLIEILDNRNMLADYINQEGITVGLTKTYNHINGFEAFIPGGPISFSFKRGRVLMKTTVKIVGQPRTTATMTFKGGKEASNLLNDANFLMNVDMTVSFIDCEIGDIFDSKTSKCNTCEEGTYSLVSPYSDGAVCIKCESQEAVCLGGNKIAPNPGYWRFDITTAKIIECPATEACLGGYVDEKYDPNGQCAYPYQGNLCNNCADNYAKFGSSSTCVNCETDTMYYVKFAGFFAIQIIALLYGIKCNVSKISEVKKAYLENNQELKDKIHNEDFQSNLMKVAVNFLQVSNVVIQYKFEWPSFVKEFVGATNKIVPSDKEGFSIDCILALIAGKSDYVHFVKLVVVLIQPFCLWLILVVCYIIYLIIKKKPLVGNPELRKTVIVLFIITAFIVQPTIIQATLEVFKCQNFSSPETPIYFMVQSSDIECWTSTHLFWALAVALPNFLLWTLILPLIVLIVLRKKAKDLTNPDIYATYSFLYEGLKTDKYYWEFVILARKTLVVMIFVFLSFISVQSQAFATFLVIIGFGFLHYVCWPYSDDKLNKAEMVSLGSLGVMIYCGMFFLSNGGNDWVNMMLLVGVCIFNVGFFAFLTILFVRSYKRVAKRMVKKITQISDKIKEKRKLSKSGSISSEKKNSVVDVNIKDLSMILNKIDIDGSNLTTPNLVRHSESLKKYQNLQNEGPDESWIPSESPQLGSDKSIKTSFYEDKVNIDNYSILKGSSKFRTARTLLSNKTGVIPELDYYKVKASLVNSNEQEYLGRSFSTNWRVDISSIKKEHQNEEDSRNE